MREIFQIWHLVFLPLPGFGEKKGWNATLEKKTDYLSWGGLLKAPENQRRRKKR